MLPEISLNILDIAQNSVRAKASLIQILLHIESKEEKLTVTISDNGSGMTKEQLAHVTDPFYTSRTTRRVGLGIPFLKQSAECTGGAFSIESSVGKGTTVAVSYYLNHIDCMPLGDVNQTIEMLVTSYEDIDFVYRYEIDEKGYELDTRQMRQILGGVPFSEPDVRAFIKEYLKENKKEIDEIFDR